jgi:putative phosphoesterase
MKLALLGDVHGNAVALSAVLTAAKEMGVEHLLVTGDLVGYYFSPAKVLALLEPWSRDVVRGNHEDMLTVAQKDQAALESIKGRYGSGIEIALDQLTEVQLNEIDKLPYKLELEIGGSRIYLCHGAPWDVDQYIYPDAKQELLQRCIKHGFDYVLLGHTHYPMAHKIGNTQIINPGSVGQPRNRQPGAQWALLDTYSRRLEFRVEQYDRAPLIRECKLRHPELPYLADILERT